MSEDVIRFVDLNTQYQALKLEINNRIQQVLDHGQYIMGPEVGQLEEKLATYTSAKHCITVASGTEALMISLMALGVKSGDEVITTPFTFISAAEAIVLLGAKPVFVDIELNTCNINVNLIESCITSRTKAIIPVSLYGQPADMDEINSLAAKYGNIPVIEDAAQSFGAEYKGRKSCNLSTIGCTSFFPSKPLGCYGDGGAIFTNDEELANSCREIRVHGQTSRYVHTRIGVGGRMDTLQCAIVLAKLEVFDQEIKKRYKIGARYNKLFDELGVKRVQQRSDRTSVFAQYTVLVENRQMVQKKLNEYGVPSSVHYPVPINKQSAYVHKTGGHPTPISQLCSNQVLSLPMGPTLSLEHQLYVVNGLRRALL